MIFLFRNARTIQRITRGYYVRTDLTNRRIKDVHYASKTNRYQRLVYYAEHYPDLIWSLGMCYYLHVDSLTYAFGWSAFLCRIIFCDTLVVIFLSKYHHHLQMKRETLLCIRQQQAALNAH
jgi:hypothetical protein